MNHYPTNAPAQRPYLGNELAFTNDCWNRCLSFEFAVVPESGGFMCMKSIYTRWDATDSKQLWDRSSPSRLNGYKTPLMDVRGQTPGLVYIIAGSHHSTQRHVDEILNNRPTNRKSYTDKSFEWDGVAECVATNSIEQIDLFDVIRLVAMIAGWRGSVVKGSEDEDGLASDKVTSIISIWRCQWVVPIP